MVPFNRPTLTGKEQACLEQVIRNRAFSGNGEFTGLCSILLEQLTGCPKAILTSSCTDALEMAALLCGIEPGDEVIIPSFTFVSTANAFALRGASIVWWEIRADTRNADETRLEDLVTPRTKAVVAVHYAGMGCAMGAIAATCRRHGLYLVEDAAQAICSSLGGIHLGRFGDLGTLSFHETKNIQCGEGGALLVNNPAMVERAQFIRDKGTNRILFNQGLVDKYTWVELGSSFLMSELQAAFLHPQLQSARELCRLRCERWQAYHQALSRVLPPWRLPPLPDFPGYNGHLFPLLLDSPAQREAFIRHLADRGVMAVSHYVPLHQAPYWRGRYAGLRLETTERVAGTLVRLPLFHGMDDHQMAQVVEAVRAFFPPSASA